MKQTAAQEHATAKVPRAPAHLRKSLRPRCTETGTARNEDNKTSGAGVTLILQEPTASRSVGSSAIGEEFLAAGVRSGVTFWRAACEDYITPHAFISYRPRLLLFLFASPLCVCFVGFGLAVCLSGCTVSLSLSVWLNVRAC